MTVVLITIFFNSGTMHEDQPSHLIVKPELKDVPLQVSYKVPSSLVFICFPEFLFTGMVSSTQKSSNNPICCCRSMLVLNRGE